MSKFRRNVMIHRYVAIHSKTSELVLHAYKEVNVSIPYKKGAKSVYSDHLCDESCRISYCGRKSSMDFCILMNILKGSFDFL